jgi:hypothetical protein
MWLDLTSRSTVGMLITQAFDALTQMDPVQLAGMIKGVDAAAQAVIIADYLIRTDP